MRRGDIAPGLPRIFAVAEVEGLPASAAPRLSRPTSVETPRAAAIALVWSSISGFEARADDFGVDRLGDGLDGEQIADGVFVGDRLRSRARRRCAPSSAKET